MNKKLVLMTMILIGLGVVLTSCAGMMTKPTVTNFKDPVIKLDFVEVSYYEGFWTYGNAKVARGKAPRGGGSSPVTLTFIFEITNPNNYPVSLDTCHFFLFFDDYELRIVKDMNAMWIPGGKTNSKVLHVTLTPNSTAGKFALAGAELARKRGDKPWSKIEQWWTGLPDMSFKIDIKEASFGFKADGISKVVSFQATYPA